MIDHIPVLRDEVVYLLEPRSGVVIVDGTVGSAGTPRRSSRRSRPSD